MIPWLFSLLVVLVPPGRHPRESEAAARIRYASIAEDIAEVAADRPTAALLVAIAVHESGLRLDVDQGLTRGEGKDVCLLQLRTSDPEVLHDRKACFRAGLRLVRASLAACSKSPRRDRLAAYASGTCERGLPESRAMIDMANRALAHQEKK